MRGMSVTTRRPLAVDEVLSFAFSPSPSPVVSGRACVLRDHGGDVYGLRFEPLSEGMLAGLGDLMDLGDR